VLEQDGLCYALVVMYLLCVDEALYLRIADAVADLGIAKERLIVSAIHTHASPRGLIPDEGPWPKLTVSADFVIVGYANGYYRYIGGEAAYEAGYYEALAAIIARGEGEKLVKEMLQLLY